MSEKSLGKGILIIVEAFRGLYQFRFLECGVLQIRFLFDGFDERLNTGDMVTIKIQEVPAGLGGVVFSAQSAAFEILEQIGQGQGFWQMLVYQCFNCLQRERPVMC